jgi:uncharacterized protein YceH (UPF0502 family)
MPAQLAVAGGHPLTSALLSSSECRLDNIDLTPNEARVIGCLMEKSVITPDQYPLSLNALMNACNQKSSRDPVLNLDPGVVQRTVNDLVAKRLIMVQNFGSRVDKYQQRFCNTQFAQLKFSPAEFAIVCLLLLRGPQTPGELKAHSGRLHEFADAAEVEAALEALLAWSGGPLVARLPREPRRKDHAYAHLFSGPIASVEREAAVAPGEAGSTTQSAVQSTARVTLEARVAALEREVAALKQALGIASE